MNKVLTTTYRTGRWNNFKIQTFEMVKWSIIFENVIFYIAIASIKNSVICHTVKLPLKLLHLLFRTQVEQEHTPVSYITANVFVDGIHSSVWTFISRE